MKDFIKLIVPGEYESIIMTISGGVGGCISYALGGIDDALIWLIILVVVDYVTGTFASFKLGTWCSSAGFRGIFKKVFIFAMAALCHGIDQTTHVAFLRDVCIFAYAVNEFGSILENIERMGYGRLLPPFVKTALKVLQDKEKKLIAEKVDDNDESLH